MRIPSGKGRVFPESKDACKACKHPLTNTMIYTCPHTAIKKCNMVYNMSLDNWNASYLVVALVPITNKQTEISIWVGIRDRNPRSLINVECSISSSSFVKLSWWEICEGAYLIFSLKLIGKVCVWGDGAIGSQNPILPWVLPLFNPIPKSITNNKNVCVIILNAPTTIQISKF